jgi:plasmid stabilization system protein ParE
MAALTRMKEEVDRLSGQLEHARTEREAVERERAALSARLQERSSLQQEVQALRLELHVAREQQEQAQQEVQRMETRVQDLLAQAEAGRVKFAQAEQHYRQQVRELVEWAAHHGPPTAGGGDNGNGAAQLDALRAEAATARHDAEVQLAAAKSEARQAVKVRDETIEKLDQLMAAHAALEIATEQLREQVHKQARDMDALRQDAASQVAAAHSQAGDLQREYAQLSLSAGSQHQAERGVAAGLHDLHEQLLKAGETIEDLAARLSRAAETEPRARTDEDLDIHARDLQRTSADS